MRCEVLLEHEVKTLCVKAREILAEEGNVQVIDTPVTVGFQLVFCWNYVENLDFWAVLPKNWLFSDFFHQKLNFLKKF